MIIKPRYKRQLKCIVLLSIILMTTVSALVFPTDFANSPIEPTENGEEPNELENIDNPIELPKSSTLGNDTWWDQSWHYRRIINVTNPYSVNFTNFGVKVVFNYDSFGSRIQSDLDDLRIIEYFNDKAIERSYFVEKDYPDPDYATVWFDNNITDEPDPKLDTYLYYGNPDATNAESRDALESFGYVRNGDFEYDYAEEETKYIPYGWNFTDDPIDVIQGGALSAQNINNEPFNNTEIADSWENFQYRVISDEEVEGYEDIGSGDYAYKFGNKANSLPNTQTLDYVGTFYSFPFTVPTIEGADLALNLWRNVHTYIFMPSNQYLDKDGYYIRICNGSATKYTSNVDLQEDANYTGGPSGYNNYVDIFGGNSRYAARWREEYELRGHPDEVPVIDTRYYYDDPYGDTKIDLNPYMGQDLFIEIGSWGQENGDPYTATHDYRGGFFQIDSVEFNYTLTGIIDELQSVDNEVTVVAVDVDGRVVPNVEIFIVNNSARGTSDFVVNESVATDGTITFTHVPRGRYNITANYTLASGQTVEVFNSTVSGDGPYYFNGLNYTVQIQLNIWTIDFEIVDWDGVPLTIGYIEMSESKGGTWLQNVTLDDDGKATFRWLNAPSYYYKVWYDNDDYTRDLIHLNESYVYRSAYTPDDVKFTHHTINMNETHDGSYSISERIYTNYSNSLGNKKINGANITLSDMVTYLTDISVYYIDEDDETTGNLIYYEEYDPVDLIIDDYIELDISLIDQDNIRTDNFEAYGLLLEVNGVNSSDCDGIIQVDLIETCNVYNTTELARLNITTTYWNSITFEQEELSAYVRVYTTGIPSLINLSSSADAIPPLEDGQAYGIINKVPLWYLRGWTYNFTIDVANGTAVNFNVTINSGPNQWTPDPGEKISEYNYTLYEKASLTFCIIPDVGVNVTAYDTAFERTYSNGSVYWGRTINLWAKFVWTDDNWATNSTISDPPGSCSVVIKLSGTDVILFDLPMTYTGSNGNYTFTFNSGLLSAGSLAKNYLFEIRGYHPIYDNPTPAVEYMEIKAIPTILKSYDYNTRTVLADNLYTQNWAELVNITLAYNISATGVAITNPLTSVSYSWSFGSGNINLDPLYNEFYKWPLNTSEAITTGLKVITITAALENYTTTQLTISLYVEDRATSLNGQSGFVYVAKGIWVQDPYNFVFTYRDVLTGAKLTNLGVKTYTWQQTDVEGLPMGGSGSGALTETATNEYVLDFDTANRAIGYYVIIATLQKDNYEGISAFISLSIHIRGFEAELDATELDDDLISVVQGEEIDFEVTVLDTSRGSIPLTGATVKIEIGDVTHNMDEDSPGVYKYTFDTEDVDAFFTSKTYTVTIIIEKLNFEDDEIEVTVVVQMEEIFDGMPTFYFIMIVSAISAVVGALAGYRIIQQARIPGFVKKCRALKKSIKSKSSAPSISIPTKNKMFLKQFNKDWKDIGINLSDILGVEDKKTTLITKAKDLIKQKGGAD